MRGVMSGARTPRHGQFVPTDISSLTAWWDFADPDVVTTVSGLISEIADKSGNGFDVSQSVATDRPEYAGAINGRNVAQYTDVGDEALDEGGVTGTDVWGPSDGNGFSLFAIVEPEIITSAGTIFFETGFGIGLEMTAAGDFRWRTIDFATARQLPMTDEQAEVVICTHDGDSSSTGAIAIRVGASMDSGTAANVAGANQITIGEVAFTSQFKLGEICTFDNEISAAEITALKNYANGKWGVPI